MMPKKWMNEEPFSYMTPRGTWFKGTRCDLRTDVRTNKPLDQIHHECFFMFGAWHRGQLHAECSGFPGYDCVKFVYDPEFKIP